MKLAGRGDAAGGAEVGARERLALHRHHGGSRGGGRLVAPGPLLETLGARLGDAIQDSLRSGRDAARALLRFR